MDPLQVSSLTGRLSEFAATPLEPIKQSLQDHVDFVPSRVPLQRRLQMTAVASWSVLFVLMTCLFLYLCSFPPLWPVLAFYHIWVHHIDKASIHGGRPSKWFRDFVCWKYFADYYPISYAVEADLPAGRNYIFGYHPHGRGAMATFATEATGFSKAFPGITPHLLTLSSNFKLPFYRDLIMWMGIASVSKRSCSNILEGGPGQSIAIVIGGAAESLSAHPGTVDLTLKKRLGFIKIAIQQGASLVPVFSFGENDGTTVYIIQKKFQSIFGFTFPLFHGRGLLNYNLGLMPYRRRIVVVSLNASHRPVGRPIHVKQIDKPDIEEIRRIQSLYIDELTRIWDMYKNDFAKARKRELNIIE
ncbi:diacylglycerol acyltransferase-domain-containing protein [Armillaria novae-zelandiae]|uniref:Diacylglycerol O-acyltransferase n=1 Tax=Armillaria novae-zelandiae TaxID=153914 RepID=A0AA39PNT5_9AGAR|nr:diacylglycerol acyltransferase-domain-containing protein [Armillaria novae-zelandiae]